MATLAQIRAVVEAYQTAQAEYQRTKDDAELCTDYEKRHADDTFHSIKYRLGQRIDWLNDLLAIAEAAQVLSGGLDKVSYVEQTIALDNLRNALAKVEGE